jgi:hypothetical protein
MNQVAASLNASSRPGDSGPLKQEWVGEIVKFGMRKEDNAMVALRERVTSNTIQKTFRTEAAALKACEEAARQRDKLALEEMNAARCVYMCEVDIHRSCIEIETCILCCCRL